MKKLLFLALTFSLVSCDPAQLSQLLNNAPLSPQEAANGLKQALNFGVDDAVKFLSAEDGYNGSAYRILLPDNANKVIDKIKFIPGFDNLESEVIKRINRAAEDAAKSAGPIFVDAIKSMSFDDVMGILTGPDNAATSYLNNRTNEALYASFTPVILQSLQKFKAQDLWSDAIKQYNRIPLLDDMNPDLTDHVTKVALVGMFDLVGKKELGIRNDISQRTTQLLQKVFAKQD